MADRAPGYSLDYGGLFYENTVTSNAESTPRGFITKRSARTIDPFNSYSITPRRTLSCSKDPRIVLSNGGHAKNSHPPVLNVGGCSLIVVIRILT